MHYLALSFKPLPFSRIVEPLFFLQLWHLESYISSKWQIPNASNCWLNTRQIKLGWYCPEKTTADGSSIIFHYMHVQFSGKVLLLGFFCPKKPTTNKNKQNKQTKTLWCKRCYIFVGVSFVAFLVLFYNSQWHIAAN